MFGCLSFRNPKSSLCSYTIEISFSVCEVWDIFARLRQFPKKNSFFHWFSVLRMTVGQDDIFWTSRVASQVDLFLFPCHVFMTSISFLDKVI